MTEKKKVLLIEDSVLQNTLWTHEFEELTNVTSVFATTLAAAKEVLGKIEFDLIFLDGDLDKDGPYEKPQTFDLFLGIAEQCRGKIFSTTDSPRYEAMMADQGCPHVEKANVAEFTRTFLEMTETKSSYDQSPGKLLAIQLGGMLNQKPLQVYIAEVITTSPLLLKVTEEGPLSHVECGKFKILPDESAMIQGNRIQRDKLLEHYAKYMAPIESGLAQFGGILRAVSPF